jgi:hypothetical protein
MTTTEYIKLADELGEEEADRQLREKIRSGLAQETTTPPPVDPNAPKSIGTDLKAAKFPFDEPVASAVPKERPGYLQQLQNDIARGADILTALGGGAVATAGNLLGSRALEQTGIDIYQSNMEEVKQNPALIGSFTNIKSVDDGFRYLIEAFGENALMMVPGIVTGGASGLVARRVLQAGAEKAVEGLIARGMTKEAAVKAVTSGMSQKIGVAQAAGAYPTSAALETGGIAGEMYEQTGEIDGGLALTGGAIAGALDTIPNVAALQMAVGRKAAGEVVDKFSKALGKNVAKEFFTEAPTELVQEIINAATVAQKTGEDIFSEEKLVGYIDAFLKGGLGSVPISAGATVIGRIGKTNTDQSDAAYTQTGEREQKNKPVAPAPTIDDALGALAGDQYNEREERTVTLTPTPKLVPVDVASMDDAKLEEAERRFTLAANSAAVKFSQTDNEQDKNLAQWAQAQLDSVRAERQKRAATVAPPTTGGEATVDPTAGGEPVVKPPVEGEPDTSTKDKPADEPEAPAEPPAGGPGPAGPAPAAPTGLPVDNTTPESDRAAEPTISEKPESSELVGAAPTLLAPAEPPTEPTIREKQQDSPMVGTEPAAPSAVVSEKTTQISDETPAPAPEPAPDNKPYLISKIDDELERLTTDRDNLKQELELKTTGRRNNGQEPVSLSTQDRLRRNIKKAEKKIGSLTGLRGGVEKGTSKATTRALNLYGTEQAPKVKAKRVRPEPNDEFSRDPIVQAIKDAGGLLSKAELKRRGMTTRGGEMDDIPEFRGPSQNAIFNPQRGLTADEMAPIVLGDGASASDLWTYLGELTLGIKNKDQSLPKTLDDYYEQQEAASKARDKAQDEKISAASPVAIPASALNVGERFQLNRDGQPKSYTVAASDPDFLGEVELVDDEGNELTLGADDEIEVRRMPEETDSPNVAADPPVDPSVLEGLESDTSPEAEMDAKFKELEELSNQASGSFNALSTLQKVFDKALQEESITQKQHVYLSDRLSERLKGLEIKTPPKPLEVETQPTQQDDTVETNEDTEEDTISPEEQAIYDEFDKYEEMVSDLGLDPEATKAKVRSVTKKLTKAGVIDERDVVEIDSVLKNYDREDAVIEAESILSSAVGNAKEKRLQSIPPKVSPEDQDPVVSYRDGDRIKFNGKTQQISGGTFYEFEYLEGRKKGEAGVTMNPPASVLERIQTRIETPAPAPEAVTPAPAVAAEPKAKELQNAAGVVLTGEEAETADFQMVLAQARAHYTLWMVYPPNREGKRPSPNYLTILGQNLEEARRKAVEVGKRLLAGDTTGVAFWGQSGAEIRKDQTLGLLEEVRTKEQLREFNRGPVGSSPVGFGKHSTMKVDDLVVQQPGYVEWLITDTGSKSGRVKTVVDYLKQTPLGIEILESTRGERERIAAYEQRQNEKLTRKQTISIENTTTDNKVQNKKVEKKKNRKASEQIVDIVAAKSEKQHVPQRLAKNMFPIQVDGANSTIESLDKYGASLNGDGAGVGKTRQIIAVADHYARQGLPVVIITENAAIGKPWEGRKVPVLGGSMAKDSQAMGVKISPLDTGETPANGEIRITTYHRVAADQIPANAVIIFDESHNLSNTFGDITKPEGNWKDKFGAIFSKASRMAFYSATPADKPHQLAYLYKVLGLGSPQEYLEEARANGMIIRTRKFGKTEQRLYDVPRSETAKRKLYGWVNGKVAEAGAKGRAIKREISYEGTDIQFHDTKGVDPAKNPWAEEFLGVMADLQGVMAQGWILPALESHILYSAELAKIGDALNMVQRELAAGRKVVLFFSRIQEHEIKGRQRISSPDGETSLSDPVVLFTVESPVVMLREELEKLGIKYVELHSKSGDTSKTAQEKFAKDVDVMLASVESGGTGINLDDTTGKNPRTEIFMFAPYRGISTIQAMGRVWRSSTVQDDDNPNRYIFVVASDISQDAVRSAVLAKKLQLMNASLGGTAVSRLPMSKVGYSPNQLAGVELADSGDESPIMVEEEYAPGPLLPVEIKRWGRTQNGEFITTATADLLEWMERGGPEKTGLQIRVFKGRDGKWIALAAEEYKPEQFELKEPEGPVTDPTPITTEEKAEQEPLAPEAAEAAAIVKAPKRKSTKKERPAIEDDPEADEAASRGHYKYHSDSKKFIVTEAGSALPKSEAAKVGAIVLRENTRYKGKRAEARARGQKIRRLAQSDQRNTAAILLETPEAIQNLISRTQATLLATLAKNRWSIPYEDARDIVSTAVLRTLHSKAMRAKVEGGSKKGLSPADVYLKYAISSAINDAKTWLKNAVETPQSVPLDSLTPEELVDREGKAKEVVKQVRDKVGGIKKLSAQKLSEQNGSELAQEYLAHILTPDSGEYTGAATDADRDAAIKSILDTRIEMEGATEVIGSLTRDGEEVGEDSPDGTFLISDESYNEALAALRRNLGRANLGVDPSFLVPLIKIGAYHAERGAREFGLWAEKMLEVAGDSIRDFLKRVYAHVKRVLRGTKTGFTKVEDVKAAPVPENVPTTQELEKMVMESREVQELIEFESQANATPETLSMGLEMDKARMFKLLGERMYNGDLGETITKEISQNSFDAIKDAEELGIIQKGEGTIVYGNEYKGDTVSVMFADNGVGMTPKILQEAFFTVGGTHKRSKKASGGFGLAKMAMFMTAERVFVETVSDGVVTTADVSNEQLLGGTFPVSVKTDNTRRNGTFVKLTIPRTLRTEDGKEKNFSASTWMPERSLLYDLKTIGSGYSSTPNEREVLAWFRGLEPRSGESELRPRYLSSRDAIADAFKKQNPKSKIVEKSIKVGGVTVNITALRLGLKDSSGNWKSRLDIIPKRQEAEESDNIFSEYYANNASFRVFSNGLRQFESSDYLKIDTNGSWWDEDNRLPWHIMIDVDAGGVDAASSEYPFTNNRESFRPGDVEVEVNRFIEQLRGEEALARFDSEFGKPLRGLDGKDPVKDKPVLYNNVTHDPTEPEKKFLKDFARAVFEQANEFVRVLRDAEDLGFTDRQWSRVAPKATDEFTQTPYGADIDYFYGAGLSKNWGGVNTGREPTVVLVNPVYRRQTEQMLGSERGQKTLAKWWTHILMHEVNHALARNEGADFTFALSETDSILKTPEDGSTKSPFDKAAAKMYSVLSKHVEAVRSLKQNYDNASTKDNDSELSGNTARSFGLPDPVFAGRSGEPAGRSPSDGNIPVNEDTGLAGSPEDGVEIASGDQSGDGSGRQQDAEGGSGVTLGEALNASVKARRPVLGARAADPIIAANRTARSAGAVGARAITPRYVAETTSLGETVLNFGAGIPDPATGKYTHSETVREAGATVEEYDFGDNSVGQLGKVYDTVFASNVLNVQSGREMLRQTLSQIAGATGKRAVMNYPESPRYMDLSPEQVAKEIEDVFGVAPSVVGGTRRAPLWEVKVPTATAKQRVVDALEAAPRGFASKVRFLTSSERGKLRKDTIEKFVRIHKELPSEKEFAAVALGGQAKRGWYRRSAQAILEVFGVDAPRFAALLAATSPQTSVENNLINALNIWKNWVAAGRPTDRESIVAVMGRSVMGNKGEDSVLDAWINNSVRALSSEDPESLVISGPKVNSFMLNLRGVVNEVTNDAWMANFALVDQTIFSGSLNKAGTDPGKGPGYLAMSARVRAAAKYLTDLTGETWTPAEVQETVWSWAKTLYELQERQGESRTALEILQAGDLTDEAIASTPDFATLLNNGIYKQILTQAGYGDALAKLSRSDTGSTGETQRRFDPEAGSALGKTIRNLQERSARRLTELYKQRQRDRRTLDARAETGAYIPPITKKYRKRQEQQQASREAAVQLMDMIRQMYPGVNVRESTNPNEVVAYDPNEDTIVINIEEFGRVLPANASPQVKERILNSLMVHEVFHNGAINAIDSDPDTAKKFGDFVQWLFKGNKWKDVIRHYFWDRTFTSEGDLYDAALELGLENVGHEYLRMLGELATQGRTSETNILLGVNPPKGVIETIVRYLERLAARIQGWATRTFNQDIGELLDLINYEIDVLKKPGAADKATHVSVAKANADTDDRKLLMARARPERNTESFMSSRPFYSKLVRGALENLTYKGEVMQDLFDQARDLLVDTMRSGGESIGAEAALRQVLGRTPQEGMDTNLAVASKAVAADWFEQMAKGFRQRGTPDALISSEYYDQKAADLRVDMAANNASPAGQTLAIFSYISKKMRERELGDKYTKPITTEQSRKFDGDPAAQEIEQEVEDAVEAAAESVVAKADALISKLEEKAKGTATDLTDDQKKAAEEIGKETKKVVTQKAIDPDRVVKDVAKSIAKAIERLGMSEEDKAKAKRIPFFETILKGTVRRVVKQQFDALLEAENVRPEDTEAVKEAKRKRAITALVAEVQELDIAQRAFEEAKAKAIDKAMEDPDSGITEEQLEILEGLTFNDSILPSAVKVMKASINMREMVKRSLKAQRTSLARLTAEIAEMAGLNEEQASVVARALANEYQKSAKAEIEKAIDRLIKSNDPQIQKAIKSRSTHDKLFEAANLGALRRRSVWNAIAANYGLPSYDPEFVKRIEEEAQRIQDLPEDSQQRNLATRLLMTEIAYKQIKEAKGFPRLLTYVDTFLALWKAGILSGPPTQAVNFGFSHINSLLSAAAKAQALARMGKVSNNKAAKSYLGYLSQLLRGTYSQLGRAKNEAANALNYGYSRFQNEKIESLGLLEGIKFDKKNPWSINTILSPAKYVGRFMQATDALNSSMASEMAQIAAVEAYILENKLDAKQAAELRAKIFDASEDVRKAATQQANDEFNRGDFGPTDDKKAQRLRDSRIEELVEREREKHVEGLIPLGRAEGERIAYNQPADRLIGFIMRGLFAPLNRTVRATQVLMPFPNTIANLLNTTIDYTPYGFLRAKNKSLSDLFAQSGKLSDEFAPKQMAKGTLEYEEAISKAWMGTIGMAAIFALVFKGWLDREDEEDEEPFFEVTAEGPSDLAAREQLRSTGWMPNSVKIGGLRLRYTDWPALNLVMGALGTLTDRYVYDKRRDFSFEDLLPAAISVFSTTLDRNMLSGLSDFFDIVNNPNTKGANTLTRLSFGVIGGVTNPNLFRWMRNTLAADETGMVPRIEQRTWAGRFHSLVPGNIAGYGEASMNVFAEPIRSYRLEASLNRFGSFFDKSHPVITPLAESGLFLTDPSYQVVFSIPKGTKIEDYKLTPSEQRDFSKIRGPILRKKLDQKTVSRLRALASTDYDAARDELQRISTSATQEAKAIYSKRRGWAR